MTCTLLVDDNEDLLASLSTFLKAQGHQVLTATKPRAAIMLLRDQNVDVVVTDIVMPGEDGLSLLRYLSAEEDETLPVIAMSGGGDSLQGSDALAFARSYGAKEILYKPFKTQELLAAIQSVLAG